MPDRHEPNGGYFPVTFIHRDDVVVALRDEGHLPLKKAIQLAKSLTDDDMKLIAEKMGEAYTSNGYWVDLDIIATDVMSDKMMRE